MKLGLETFKNRMHTKAQPQLLPWAQFFKIRIQRNRFQLGLGLVGGLIGLQTSAFYLLTQRKFDPTFQLIPGMDMTIVYMAGIILAALGGFVATSLGSNPVFRMWKKDIIKQFDANEANFAKRILKHR
jgi:hypothetical protein